MTRLNELIFVYFQNKNTTSTPTKLLRSFDGAECLYLLVSPGFLFFFFFLKKKRLLLLLLLLLFILHRRSQLSRLCRNNQTADAVSRLER